jgi:alpha-1,2-mannosyltransferase
MEAEHFGISCVEMMAAGVILVAHNSAGPKADIIKHASSEQERCGYLADNYEDYVSMLTEAILSKYTKLTIQKSIKNKEECEAPGTIVF